MKNQGLIRHRQHEVSDEKALAGVGFFIFVLTIEIWAAAAWIFFWLINRWGDFDFRPQWWELNIASAVINFTRLWDRAMFSGRKQT